MFDHIFPRSTMLSGNYFLNQVINYRFNGHLEPNCFYKIDRLQLHKAVYKAKRV